MRRNFDANQQCMCATKRSTALSRIISHGQHEYGHTQGSTTGESAVGNTGKHVESLGRSRDPEARLHSSQHALRWPRGQLRWHFGF